MTFIFNKEQFLSIKESFKKAEHKSGYHYVIYNIIRGAAPDRGFTPATSKNKLVNGYRPMHAYEQSQRYARMFLSNQSKHWSSDHLREIFGPLLTDEKCAEMYEVIK